MMRRTWLLLALTACSPDPPTPLQAGDCREDSDCPGALTCRNERPGHVGRCACTADIACPLLLRCDADGGLCQCEALPAERGGCGFLQCAAETRTCRCAGDEDCRKASGETSGEASGPGCLCVDGQCIREDGDDLLLCDLRLVPSDAGPNDRVDAAAGAALDGGGAR